MEVLERQVGTTTRLRVLEAGENRFVKRPSALLRARAITELAGLTAAEVRFYRELAREVPIRVPRLVRGRHRPWSFELVVEDLTATGCQVLRPRDSLTLDQARRVFRMLAALHTEYWESPRLDGELRWLEELRRRETRLGERLARPLTEVGLWRAGPLVPKALHPGLRRYASERGRVAQLLGRGPRTVVHHDCHPGNLFFTPEGEPGLLDWQLVRIGSWASDIAYLLATSLTTPDRRKHGAELLTGYLEALPAALRPEPEAARNDIAAHTAYALEAMLLTLALGGLMAKEDVRRQVHRTAIAALDAEAFGVLGLA